jgi:hypothetical protein
LLLLDVFALYDHPVDRHKEDKADPEAQECEDDLVEEALEGESVHFYFGFGISDLRSGGGRDKKSPGRRLDLN